MGLLVIPLQELLKQSAIYGRSGEERVKSILSTFHCEPDQDIEGFLKNRAVDFERLYKARTYLVCDEDDLSEGTLYLLGYFSLSLKVLILPDELSIRGRKNYDGFSGKIHGQKVREIPCYLIGQLGRNSRADAKRLPGHKLLSLALNVIEPAVNAVGGRLVLVECHNKRKLTSFYADNGFDFIMEEPDGDIPMVQMVRRIL